MKPALSYYGGDQRMSPHILPYVESIPHTVWVEPFAGGAAMTFAKPRKVVSNGDHYREVLNDLNGLITTFYRVARDQPEELRHQLEHTLYSQADYREAVAICKEPHEHSDLKVAWATYINCNASFAKKMNGGWSTAVINQNSAATWENRINDRLPLQLERLRGVYISNEDAIACIKRWDSPQTLFYCHPPYPGADQGHYEGYTQQDFEDLVNVLQSCKGSAILHCYDNSAEPKDWLKVEIDAFSSAAKVKGRDRTRKATAEEMGDRKRTECLWICDRSHGMRDELSFSRYKQYSLFEIA